MSVIPLIATMLFLAPALPVYGTSQIPERHARWVESAAFTPASRESTVTRIGNVQQPYAIGSAGVSDSPGCVLLDRPDSVIFGATSVASLGAWVVWDLAGFPDGAEVIRVEIEHMLEPAEGNEPGLRLLYRKIEGAYLPPPECWTAWNCLYSCPAYTDVQMGTWIGTRRYVLGGTAVDDVQGLLHGRELFCVGLTVDYSDGLIGAAWLPGWNAGGADLLVTWRDSTPVESVRWGSVKALFRP